MTRTAGLAHFVKLSAVLLGLAVSSQAAAQAQVGSQPDPGGRIVGGKVAAEGAWPWQIVFMEKDRSGRFAPICGGTLIAPQWVLTAAHCVPNWRTSTYQVGYGSNTLNKVQAVAVTQVIPHADYNSERMDNDIALIKLAAPVTPTNSVRFAALATSGTSRAESLGDRLTVTGFGRASECLTGGRDRAECRMQDKLQEVEVPVVSAAECNAANEASGATIGERQICAGYTEGGRDSCQGDSGGPLVRATSDGRWEQVGVVSWGEGCARANRPGVYTRVAAYRDWLAKQMGPSDANPVLSVVANDGAIDALKSAVVTIAPVKSQLKVGEAAQFNVTSSIDGYLLIYDVSPAGKVTQLFPNDYSAASGTPAKVAKGQTILFPAASDPFEVKVTEPKGQGLVVAVIAKQATGVQQLLDANGKLQPINDMKAFHQRLAVVLKDKKPINPVTAEGDWGMGESIYNVDD